MKKFAHLLVFIIIPIFTFSQNLNSIIPSIGNNGQNLNVTITGTNTSFIQGSGSIIGFEFDQGSPSVINFYNVVSNTSITANITIPQNTTTGDYDVYTYNSVDGLLLLPDGFHVNGVPSSLAISPANANVGQTLNVTITGTNTNFSQGSGSVIGFEFDQGSPSVVNFYNVINNTSIFANITIPLTTSTGDYDVFVYNSIDGTLLLNDGFHVGPLSIDSYNINSMISIFPSPALTQLNIKSKGIRVKEVEIFDIKGKSINKLTPQKGSVNIEYLSSGVYFLKVYTKEGIVTKKFVKQ
jgi:hypothetical protein